MDESMRVIEYIKDVAEVVETADGSKISASQMLERFLFTPASQWTPISKLSGGEKRRLYLLRVLMGAPNVLLLDEPTNDLDITTLTVLEQYLDEFPGVVFAVSHDRYFLDRTCDRIFAFEGEGQVSIHAGNYSDYEERIADLAKIAKAANAPVVAPKAVEPAPVKEKAPAPDKNAWRNKVKFSYKEQLEYEQIDKNIADTEQKLVDLASDMEKAFSDSVRLQELMAEQTATEKHLEHLMERWTYLTELAEKIQQSQN